MNEEGPVEVRGPHISIKGEHLFDVSGFSVTNSLLASLVVTVLLGLIAYYYFTESKKKNKGAFYYVLNSFLSTIYNLFYSVLGEKTATFFPLLGAFFFFILLNNWFGLIPGVGSILTTVSDHGETHTIPLLRGGTADLNTTFALAIVSVVMTQYFGFRFIGLKSHLGKYLNFSNPVNFFVGILEFVLEFARIVSFSFRLFGNIFAGEVLLTVVTFLLPALFSFVTFPMFGMELFVGLVQALVFTMLTAVFINMAIQKHH